MRSLLGFRVLISISVALGILLGAISFEQYRWSKKVASADIQRERDHLDASTALFIYRFNRKIAEAASFLRDDVQNAITANAPVGPRPPLILEIYQVNRTGGSLRSLRLDMRGKFVSVPTPAWVRNDGCVGSLAERPLVMSVHVVDEGARGSRCFYAVLNEDYIRETLMPQLLPETYGASFMEDYDFEVASRQHPEEPICGPKIAPDMIRAFLTVPAGFGGDGQVSVQDERPLNLPPSRNPVGRPPGPPLQQRELWQIEIAHRGVSYAQAFRKKYRLELLLGLCAELLIGATVGLLMLAAHRTRQAADARMRFVAAVSHELRTPISSISMLSRNQADGMVSGADKVSQYGELIHQQSRRLSDMIEQVLQYAGFHSGLGTHRREPVDIRTVVADALAANQDELDGMSFRVELNVADDLPPVLGDGHLLRIAVSNLITNAIKYANKGRWLGVEVTSARDARAVLIHISDNGPGIDFSEKHLIFEPFFRGRIASEHGAPGSGIGLSLVRSAVEGMGGSVTITRTTPKGSVFTVRLPT